MPEKKYEYPEIRIRGIGKNTKEQLENIASHLGFDKINDFYKNQLQNIINSYPEKMKLTKKN